MGSFYLANCIFPYISYNTLSCKFKNGKSYLQLKLPRCIVLNTENRELQRGDGFMLLQKYLRDRNDFWLSLPDTQDVQEEEAVAALPLAEQSSCTVPQDHTHPGVSSAPFRLHRISRNKKFQELTRYLLGTALNKMEKEWLNQINDHSLHYVRPNIKAHQNI